MKPPVWLTVGECEQTIAVADLHAVGPEVRVALGTGLRVGGMRRLRWGDVDMAGRVVVIHETKTGRPRTVPLSDVALKGFQLQQIRSGDFSYVFPSRHTYPGGYEYRDAPRSRVSRMHALDPVVAAIGKFKLLARGTVGHEYHLFRTTFASLPAQRGVSILKIQAWLGHSSPVTTQRYYAHLQDGYDPDVEKASR